jgi:DNA-binding MarR family transcriptional regulator
MTPRPEQLPPDELAERLARVYVVLGPVYRKVLRLVELDQRRTGMSVGVRNVLDQLRRGGDLTVPALARAQDLSRQFVQRMVNDARGAGWVEVVENPAHRRSGLVRLTRSGATAIDAVVAGELDRLALVGGGLTGPEVDATLRVLDRMQAALDDLLAADDAPR